MGRVYPNTILNITVADAVAHYSSGLLVGLLQGKTLQVFATISAGVPGPILIWVELSPNDTNYTMLGTEEVLAADGSVILPWTAHSEYARLGVRVPGGAAGNTWAVAGIFSGAEERK